MFEKIFQKILIKEIKERFKGCIVVKADANFIQDFPDLLILFPNNLGWAALECKLSSKSKIQPSQQYYIDSLNVMSYAAFIYPENKDYILEQLTAWLDQKSRLIHLK